MKKFKALLIIVAILVLSYEVSNALITSQEEQSINQNQLVVDQDDHDQDEEEVEQVDKAQEEQNIDEIHPCTESQASIEQAEQSEEEDKIEEEEEEEQEEVPEDTTLSDKDIVIEDTSQLSNVLQSWSFRRNTDHAPVIGYTDSDLSKYGAYYLGDTDEKVMYLTFDEGYENGFTPTLLDILKENDVQAAFFVTLPFMRNNPELVIRMKEEGHIVANHSVTHPSFPELTDEEVIQELRETAAYYESLTGEEMAPFFRPPMGEYSDRTLYLTRREGYRTIFWSIAYRDWVVDDQPGKDYVYQHFLDNHHPGAIPLVHAVSSSNTEALDEVIKAMKAEGYRFGSLYELE